MSGKKRICRTTNIKIDKQIMYSSTVKAFSITKRLIQTSWMLELLLCIVRLERVGKRCHELVVNLQEKENCWHLKMCRFFFSTEIIFILQMNTIVSRTPGAFKNAGYDGKLNSTCHLNCKCCLRSTIVFIFCTHLEQNHTGILSLFVFFLKWPK